MTHMRNSATRAYSMFRKHLSPDLMKTNPEGRSVILANVVSLFERGQLFFTFREFGLRCRCVLFGGHVVQHNDIPFLQVETI